MTCSTSSRISSSPLDNLYEVKEIDVTSKWEKLGSSTRGGGGGGGGGELLKHVLSGEAPPQGPNPYSFYIPFLKGRINPFIYYSIENGSLFTYVQSDCYISFLN